MAIAYYSTGTISLTNGSAVVTGTGTGWQTALVAAGVIYPQAAGNPLPIASVDSNTKITAAIAWTGATGTYSYALARQDDVNQVLRNAQTLSEVVEEIRNGTIFKYDVAGPLSELTNYGAQPKGFAYLVVDGANANLYVKRSSTLNDWAGPFAYGAGPVGPAPTLSVGTVGTVAPGQQPSAVFVGGNGAYSLNLILPEGELTPADEALLDQKVAAATAEANRAASYVPGTVASSISGLTLSNHPQYPNQLLTVSPGTARDRTNSVDIVLSSGTYKNIAAAWSAGQNGGGLDTGSVAEYSHYHIHLIRNPTSGAVDVLFSLSPSNPVMPAGFTQRRRIGALATGFAGYILPARWFGGWFKFSGPAYQPFGGVSNSAVSLRDVFVPKGIKVRASFYLFAQGSSPGHVVVADPDAAIPNLNVPESIYAHSKVLRLTSAGCEIEEWTDTNGRCYFVDNGGAGTTVSIWAKGWFDHRDEFA